MLLPVPGRIMLRKLLLRMLLLRFEPDDTLRPDRMGRLVKLSRRSSSWGSLTSQTDERVLDFRAAGSGAAGSDVPLSLLSWDAWSSSSSEDQLEDTVDR